MQRSALFLTVSSVSFSHSLFSTSCPFFYLTHISLYSAHLTLCNLLIFCQFLPHPHFLTLISHLSCYPSLALLHLQIYFFFLCFFIQFYSSFSYLYSHFTLSLCFVSFCDSFSYSFWLVLSFLQCFYLFLILSFNLPPTYYISARFMCLFSVSLSVSSV